MLGHRDQAQDNGQDGQRLRVGPPGQRQYSEQGSEQAKNQDRQANLGIERSEVICGCGNCEEGIKQRDRLRCQRKKEGDFRDSSGLIRI